MPEVFTSPGNRHAGFVLDAEQWSARRQEHQRRVSALLDPYLRERTRGQAHPVVDFLFTYYNLRPGHLRRWHPGHGIVATEQMTNVVPNRLVQCG